MTENDDSEEARRLRTICEGRVPDSHRAHGAIYRDYRPRFTAFFRRFQKNPDDLGDLVQTVFMRIWERACSFSGKGKASAWLWAVARSALFDTFDPKRVFESLDAPEPGANDSDWGPELNLPDPSADPRVYEDRELADRALSILGDVSPAYATAVYLKVVMGEEYEDIGAALGKDGGNTRQFVSECFKRYDRVVLGLLGGKTPQQIVEEFMPKRRRAGGRS